MQVSEDAHLALNAAMDRYADGDDDAFGEVYDHLAPRLLSFFVRQVQDRARAEDLVQQTLLQMHAARRNYAQGSNVLPWAFAIARHVLIDARRRSSREVLFDTAEDNAAALDRNVTRDSSPEDFAATREMAERVSRELDRLPEGQRTAYDLVRREGLSIVDAAEVLGTTPTAIKLRVHRAYEALRAVLVGEEKTA
jgi:RNA polymerase sigma-70 factor (ECF subfamily)